MIPLWLAFVEGVITGVCLCVMLATSVVAWFGLKLISRGRLAQQQQAADRLRQAATRAAATGGE
jgi:hypothetical protein